MCWREIKKKNWRKGTGGKAERVKAENDTMPIKQDTSRKKLAEYFERLLHVEEDWKPVIIAVEREGGRNVLGDLNETLFTKKEVQESV